MAKISKDRNANQPDAQTDAGEPKRSTGRAYLKSVSPLKSKPLRNPGESTQAEIDRLVHDKTYEYLFYVAGFAVLSIMEWYGYVMKTPRMPWVYTGMTLVAAAWACFKIVPIRKRVRALRQGRDGERIVAEQLDVLKKEGALILHDLPGENFNIDHVIICSKGIFVVETKTWAKSNSKSKILFDGEKLIVDGRKPDRGPIQQASAQVVWLQRLLKKSTTKDFFVKGVVVYPGWWVENAKGPKGSAVWVLEPKALPKLMATEPDRLAASDGGMAALHLEQYVRSRL